MFMKGIPCIARAGNFSVSANSNVIAIKMEKAGFYRDPKSCSGSKNTIIKRAVEFFTNRKFPRMRKAAYLVWSRSPTVIPQGKRLIQADVFEAPKWKVNREAGRFWAWLVGVLNGTITEEYSEWQLTARDHYLPGQYNRSSSDEMDDL
jgi:hypothetical protein